MMQEEMGRCEMDCGTCGWYTGGKKRTSKGWHRELEGEERIMRLVNECGGV